jgi:hypothetical protein
MAGERKSIDWEAVERDYRAGILSVREIAAARSCTHTAINKRAKAEGWARDLKAKIKAKAEALVSKREVSREVSSKAVETERQIIDANAEAIVSIRMGHRTDIRRSRGITNKLLDELEGLTDNRELFEQLGELMHSPDEKGMDRLNDLYRKVVELPNRTKVMKELADTLKTLVTLERQAYNLDEQEHDEPYEERLRRLAGEQ